MESRRLDGPPERLSGGLNTEPIPNQPEHAHMMKRWPMLHLLLLSAGPRLVGATLVIALLWALFFWATSNIGLQ